MDAESAQRNTHDVVERHELVKPPLFGEVVERRKQHSCLDGPALQGRVAAGAAADLQEGHIFFGIHAVFPQNHDRFAVRGAAEAADAEGFSF